MKTNILNERSIDNAMRGIAISCIALHNWLHKIGYAQENEYEYIAERATDFWNGLGSISIIHSLGDIMSFVGWSGVCVFMFLSGYGLEKKYGSATIKPVHFIWQQWLKLFLLMLPGVLFFILLYIDNSDRVIGGLLGFLMVDNFLHYIPGTGVYWYFGLTFQFYLIWIVLRKCSNKCLIITAICLIAFQTAMVDSTWMVLIKNNFVGFAQVFIAGMIIGRNGMKFKSNIYVTAMIAILGIISVVALNFDKYCWLIILPFASVITIWSMADLLSRWTISRYIVNWLGIMSSFIFVCHPILREVIIIYTTNIGILSSIIYVAGTLLLSIIYSMYFKTIRKLQPSSRNG